MSDGAFDVAARGLSSRDRSRAQVEIYLRERGFDDVDRAETLDALERTGIVDDARFAVNRASALADRGMGDARILFDLRDAGISDDEVEVALDAIEPEGERARRLVARRGATAKTARYLMGKGFSEEAVGAAVAQGASEGLG